MALLAANGPIIARCLAAPISADRPVSLPANAPFVLKTTAALGVVEGWQLSPGGAVGESPRMQLATWQALRAFARRCSISKLRFDIDMSSRATMLNIAFTGAAWSRILNELQASGLLGCEFSNLNELETAIDGLTILHPERLEIVSADWAFGEELNAPAGGPLSAVRAAPALVRLQRS